MNDTKTDIRLPKGFHSWLALAEKLKNQDFYNFKAQNEPAQAPFFVDNSSRIQQNTRSAETGSVIERFESDVLTIKIRAFDELNEVLPDLEGLISMRSFLSRYVHASGNDLEQAPIVKMIDKLIELKL